MRAVRGSKAERSVDGLAASLAAVVVVVVAVVGPALLGGRAETMLGFSTLSSWKWLFAATRSLLNSLLE